MSKRPSSSEKGFEPPTKPKNVEKQKNPKYCSYCVWIETTELCPDCRKRKLDPLKNPCPSRECSLSNCDEEFHLHCYQNYFSTLSGYSGRIDFLKCFFAIITINSVLKIQLFASYS